MAWSSTSLLTFRNLKQVFRIFLQVTLTFIALCFSPFIFLIYGVLLLYRLVVFKTARYFDPKLGKMVSSLGTMFAAHDVYGNCYATNIALHVVGKADRLHIIHAFENLLETSVTPEGDPQYPELMQKLVTKFGFKFWKNLDNFQVDNHVTYLNPENPDKPVTLAEMRDLFATLGKTPLDPTRSPWHILIVKNFTSSVQPLVKSAIIIRAHHVMFDGYSLLKVFGKLADNGPFVLAGPKFDPNDLQATGRISRLLKVVLQPFVILFRGVYEVIGLSLSYDKHKLIETNRREFKGIMKFHECEPIPLDNLKAVKNFYGVSMTSLMTTLVVRAVKRFHETRQINAKKIRMTFPLPAKNHPDKLRNYFTGGIISFDLTHDDRVKLLRDVDKKYYRFRFAYACGLPEAGRLLLRLLGSLPVCLTPRIDNLPLSTSIMHSSFPGPVDIGYFCGFPIVDLTVAGSISKPYPIGTVCYTYNGLFKIGFSADACIFTTPEDAEELSNVIFQEFTEFYQKVNENFV